VRIVDLAKEMGRIGVVISTRSVECTPHIAADADPQVWPAFPLREGVEPERYLRRP
jgi:hypothetical protein